MEWHQIEVDDAVFSYLQTKARAFVDAPNDVLRRELGIEATRHNAAGSHRNSALPMPGMVQEPSLHGLPSFGFGVPAALEQTLWVMRLVRKAGRSRPEATSEVARAIQVTPQTVLDKYCRQLGLTADRFDVLLREPDLSQLQRLLSDKYPTHRELVKSFLTGLEPAG